MHQQQEGTWFKTSSEIFLLIFPRPFLLWIIYVIPVLYLLFFVRVCLLMPWDHLLGNG